jgi:hypothetical protein
MTSKYSEPPIEVVFLVCGSHCLISVKFFISVEAVSMRAKAITPDKDVAQQAALLDSYRSACHIHRDRWRYRQYQSQLQAADKEMDKAADEVFGKSDDEEDIAGSAKETEGNKRYVFSYLPWPTNTIGCQ